MSAVVLSLPAGAHIPCADRINEWPVPDTQPIRWARRRPKMRFAACPLFTGRRPRGGRQALTASYGRGGAGVPAS